MLHISLDGGPAPACGQGRGTVTQGIDEFLGILTPNTCPECTRMALVYVVAVVRAALTIDGARRILRGGV